MTAVDDSPEFVEHVRARINALGLSDRVQVERRDLQALQLTPGSFDGWSAEKSWSTCPTTEPPRARSQMAFGPGVLALTVPAGADRYDWLDRWAGHERRYDESELRALLEGAGLRRRPSYTLGVSFYVDVRTARATPGLCTGGGPAVGHDGGGAAGTLAHRHPRAGRALHCGSLVRRLSTRHRFHRAREATMTEPRPVPVPSDRYSEEIVVKFAGPDYRDFVESAGQRLRPRLGRSLDLAQLEPGLHLLDLGCGRGEVAVHAALRGARVTAVDYSVDCVRLTREAVGIVSANEALDVREVLADATTLPFPDATFDRITMLDVVEHLFPWQLDLTMREVRRVLKPDGFAVIHTVPNRWALTVGYPLLRMARPGCPRTRAPITSTRST